MEEGRFIQRFRWITAISGGILGLLILGIWIGATWFPSWKEYQAEYHRLASGAEGKEGITPGPATIRQIDPDGLRRTDRCVSCHLGLENPGMAGAPQPHTMHPGGFLEDHPVEQFGCTVCHGGQGRAVDRRQAFGLDPDVHWDFPLLYPPYIESSCGKCHLSIFSDHLTLEGTETFMHGQVIFNREGCLGCHKARGTGGIIGPDLTEQGEKTKHEYSFRNIRGEQTISNWLKEHFLDPEMVSPGSDMLTIDLPEEELDALATFTMGLAKPDIAFDYIGVDALKEFRGGRDVLYPGLGYSMFCSACHGESGEGKDYEFYKTGVPAIFNYDFLRTTPGEMLRFTLLNGRGSRQMASWLPRHSGLKPAEIDSLVEHLERRQSLAMDPYNLSGGIGSPRDGREIYGRDCLQCHGGEGAGAIGLPLNNPDFLSVASDRFLATTIFRGRKMNGMPSWPDYTEEEMTGLLAYIRSWGRGPATDPPMGLPDGDPLQGSLQYLYLCSRCHGEFGEGNTGPAVLNRDFLSTASDHYLYRTISEGRSHTAMFGWTTDVQGEGKLDRQGISDVITYMRSLEGETRAYIYQGANPGNAERGSGIFERNCMECHGSTGRGDMAPALNNQEFLSSASNGYIMATITLGREGTRMPSWGNGSEEYPRLGPAERKDLVAFIRAWQRYRIKNPLF